MDIVQELDEKMLTGDLHPFFCIFGEIFSWYKTTPWFKKITWIFVLLPRARKFEHNKNKLEIVLISILILLDSSWFRNPVPNGQSALYYNAYILTTWISGCYIANFRNNYMQNVPTSPKYTICVFSKKYRLNLEKSYSQLNCVRIS